MLTHLLHLMAIAPSSTRVRPSGQTPTTPTPPGSPGSRRRSWRSGPPRLSLVSRHPWAVRFAVATLIGLVPVGPALADSSGGRKSGKKVKVAFSTVPALGEAGAPKCGNSGCMIAIQPNEGTFTGDINATVIASQTVTLGPSGSLPPTSVSVLVTVNGTIKGCGQGTIVMHGLFSDYTIPGQGGRGTWTFLPKTGTGAFAGLNGSGTVVEVLNPNFTTKSIDHTGTVTCAG